MNRKTFFKKITAIAVTVSVAAMGFALPAFADSTTDTGTGADNGSITINGTFEPLIISVTHEVSEDYTIDPNTDTLTADPIAITNNTKVPVSVTVESIQSISGGDVTFTDVLPDAKDWDTLDAADTQKYIALGLQISDPSGWDAGYNTDTDWAAAGTSTLMGTLQPSATGNLSLTAKYGHSWTQTCVGKADILIVVSIV